MVSIKVRVEKVEKEYEEKHDVLVGDFLDWLEGQSLTAQEAVWRVIHYAVEQSGKTSHIDQEYLQKKCGGSLDLREGDHEIVKTLEAKLPAELLGRVKRGF